VVEATQEAIQTTNISQVTMAHNRNFPEVYSVKERGTLMYQHALQMMGLMRDIPDPISMPRIPNDSPEESLTEPRNPDFINLGNNNGSDDPKSTIPPTNSSVCATKQP
jgi:hypothetical protein